MRIAGTKNAGAWLRYNRKLHTLTVDERGALADQLAANEHVAALFGQLQALALSVLLPASDIPFADTRAWVGQLLLVGIPLQIWRGTPLHDRYVVTNPGEPVKVYAPVLSNVQRLASVAIRRTLVNYFRIRSEVVDAMNSETNRSVNPGGRATGGQH